jgi:hypothetical protein
MPEVMRVDGYRFWIHPWTEDRPRVLVEREMRWCVIAIGGEGRAAYVDRPGDMRETDAGRAVWIVNHSQELLLAHWSRLHAT